METTQDITLKMVYDQFKEDKINKEHLANFKKLYEYHHFLETALLKDYIQYIYDHTEDWFKADTARSLKIQKTPINIIIKGARYPHFASIIDEDIRNQLPKKFTAITKKLMDGFNRRDDDAMSSISESDQSGTVDVETMTDMNTDEAIAGLHEQLQTLRKEINEQKLKNSQHLTEKSELKKLLVALLDAYQTDVPENNRLGLVEFTKSLIEKRI